MTEPSFIKLDKDKLKKPTLVLDFKKLVYKSLHATYYFAEQVLSFQLATGKVTFTSCLCCNKLLTVHFQTIG